MKAERIYNNNVVLAINSKGDEVILVGRGLAFGLGRGDFIREDKVEKKFELNKETNSKFKRLIQDIPLDHILVSEEVISYIIKNNAKHVDDSIYVTLTDHIANMLERIQNGIDFDSLLLLNVKLLYKDEYQLALEAVQIIRKRMDIRIEDTEANFIALHIVNAESNSNMMQMYTIVEIINEITSIVSKHFDIETEDSLTYDRFLTHCRFFVQRIINKEYLNGDSTNNDSMLEMMGKAYSKEVDCVEDICQFIGEKYKYFVKNNEKLYLTLHLAKLTGKE